MIRSDTILLKVGLICVAFHLTTGSPDEIHLWRIWGLWRVHCDAFLEVIANYTQYFPGNVRWKSFQNYRDGTIKPTSGPNF